MNVNVFKQECMYVIIVWCFPIRSFLECCSSLIQLFVHFGIFFKHYLFFLRVFYPSVFLTFLSTFYYWQIFFGGGHLLVISFHVPNTNVFVKFSCFNLQSPFFFVLLTLCQSILNFPSFATIILIYLFAPVVFQTCL